MNEVAAVVSWDPFSVGRIAVLPYSPSSNLENSQPVDPRVVFYITAEVSLYLWVSVVAWILFVFSYTGTCSPVLRVDDPLRSDGVFERDQCTSPRTELVSGESIAIEHLTYFSSISLTSPWVKVVQSPQQKLSKCQNYALGLSEPGAKINFPL